MRILVLQHAPSEHIGGFGPILRDAGHELVPHLAQNGVGPEDLNGIDALWVLGGPMQVWEAPDLPWLAKEIAFVRHAVLDRALPYFGICLGHQILATALGGRVGPAQHPEIGQMTVRGDSSMGAFSGLIGDIICFQWHTAEIIRVPEGANVMARSDSCAVQAMRWGPSAASVQFHAELDAATFDDWCQDPKVMDELSQTVGPEQAGRARADLLANNDAMQDVRVALFRGWQALTLPL